MFFLRISGDYERKLSLPITNFCDRFKFKVSDIQTGSKYGMQSMDSHLWELHQKGLIAYESVMSKAKHEDTIKDKIQGETQKKKRWL